MHPKGRLPLRRRTARTDHVGPELIHESRAFLFQRLDVRAQFFPGLLGGLLARPDVVDRLRGLLPSLLPLAPQFKGFTVEKLQAAKKPGCLHQSGK